MRVTITQLRKDLYKLTDRAIQGESVEFTYKGVILKVVAGKKLSKLTRLAAAEPAAGVDFNYAAAKKEMRKAMWKEIEEDWAEI